MANEPLISSITSIGAADLDVFAVFDSTGFLLTVEMDAEALVSTSSKKKAKQEKN